MICKIAIFYCIREHSIITSANCGRGGGFLLCADNADAGWVTKFRKDADVILEHSLHVVEDGGYRVGAACDSVGDNDDEEEAEETRCGSVRDARTLVQTHCP